MDSTATKDKTRRPGDFHPLVRQPSGPVAGVAALAGMAAPYLISGISATTAGLISMGVGITYSLLAGALVKPPRPKTSGLSGERGAAFHSVRNQARPYDPLQEVFGKMRVYPPLAATPYTEQVGSDTYVRMLFHIGQGEYDISSIKIGETAITTYAGEYETADGYITDSDVQAIYPAGVTAEGTLPVEVTVAGGAVTKTTAADTTEISVDVGCPNGLYHVNDDGEYGGARVFYTVQYRVNSPPGSWTDFPGTNHTVGGVDQFHELGKSQGLVSFNHRVTGLTADTYDVKVEKQYEGHPSEGGAVQLYMDDLYWMSMQSVDTDSEAVSDTDAYLLAVRIKVTGNFSGTIDSVNCIAERKVPAWSGAAWGANTKTRSAAWAYASVLRRFVADANINADALLTWAGNCTTNGFNYDAIIDQRTTAKEMLEDIAAIGRASRAIVDGLHTVIEDVAQANNLAHFSPRNTWDFAGHRDLLDIPHAIKGRYLDDGNGYQLEEIVICDDGYYEDTPSATTWAASTAYAEDDYVTPTSPNGYYYKCTAAGTSDSGEPSWPTTPRATVTDGGATWMCFDAATDYEGMDFLGVTDPDHAWKLGRYHLAVARLRPETFVLSIDAENLRNTRGDRVGLTHDVMLAGQGQARITAIAGSDVTMDDTITMEGGKTYGAIVRKADGTFLSTTITLDAGEQSTVTLGSVTGIAVGDLMFFGETDSITQDCIIKGIEYGRDHSARVTLTNYDAAVYTADGVTIPTFAPVISQPPEHNRVPPTVTIDGVKLGYWPAQSNDLGQKNLHAFIGFYLGVATDIEPAYFQVQYRSYDTLAAYADAPGGDIYSPWQYIADLPLEARQAVVPVQDGSTFDFRIRAVSRYGVTGAWATESDYAVSYSGFTPDDIAGLDLVQSGSTWPGLDCAVTWTAPADLWRVAKVKVAVYKTSPLTLLRTEYVDPDQNTYTYTFAMNEEDNAGTAIAALTFKLAAVSQNGDESSNTADLAITNAAPTNVSGATAISRIGGVEFVWTANSESDIHHYEYRFQVESDGWSQWYKTTGNRAQRYLTSTEKSTHGGNANIQIEVYVLDVFGSQSAAAGTANGDCLSLEVELADVDDYLLTPQKFSIPLPIVTGLTVTNDSPSAGYVAWTSFNLYLNGTLYSINSGNSNKEFICFKDLSTTLTDTNTHPSENWANWDPTEDFLIIWNNGGTGTKAWSSFMNLVATSGFIGLLAVDTANIAALAVTDAKINDLDADKLTANSIVVSKFSDDVIRSQLSIVGDPTFALTADSSDNSWWYQADAQVAYGASYGESGPGVRITGNSESNDLILYDGKGSLKLIPASKNDTFIFQVRSQKDGSWDGALQARIYEYNENETALTNDGVNITPSSASTWETITKVFQPTRDDCHFVAFRIRGNSDTTAGYAYIDSVNIKKEVESNWRHSSDYTKIDGGDIYANSITLSDHGAGALASGDNLDDVPDGSTYGRVNLTAISGGKIKLTSDGVTGTLAVGFTDADVTADNSQDLDWLDGSSGTLTISSTGNLAISAAGGITVTSSDGIKINSGGGIEVNSGGGVTVKSGGNITMEAGGDILLYPSDTAGNASEIVWKDSGGGTYDAKIYRRITDDKIFWQPTTDNTCQLILGADPGGSANYSFQQVHIQAYSEIDLYSPYDATNAAQIVISGYDDRITLFTYDATLRFDSGALYPLSGGSVDIGQSGYGIGDIYASSGDLGKSSNAWSSLGLDVHSSDPGNHFDGKVIWANWGTTHGHRIVYSRSGTWYNLNTNTAYT